MWVTLTATLLFSLTLSLPYEVSDIITRDASASAAAWQPPVGAKFQITLSRGLSGGGFFNRRNIEAGSAEVLDLDLFDSTKSLIQQLHSQNKHVICYFSAGSSESWRTDYNQLQAKDMGDPLRDWPREKWLDIRSPDIFKIMQARIKMASDKGCDGIDPDNVDAFSDEGRRGGGFAVPLTNKDTIEYIQKLSTEAHQYGLAMGLKNAESLLPQVSKYVEFAVNEQCATYSGCRSYQSFLNSGKPVFHIEYAKHSFVNGTTIDIKPDSGSSQLRSMTSEQLHQFYCLQSGTGNRNYISQDIQRKFSTVIKNMDLSNWVMYCDGTWEGDTKGSAFGGQAANSAAQPANTEAPQANSAGGYFGAKGGKGAKSGGFPAAAEAPQANSFGGNSIFGGKGKSGGYPSSYFGQQTEAAPVTTWGSQAGGAAMVASEQAQAAQQETAQIAQPEGAPAAQPQIWEAAAGAAAPAVESAAASAWTPLQPKFSGSMFGSWFGGKGGKGNGKGSG